MRFSWTLNRYLFKEILIPFLIAVLVLTIVLLMARMLDIARLIGEFRVSPWQVILMLVYSIPFLLNFVIPVAVMAAVFMAFQRLSNDNEIQAVNAAGISLFNLGMPVLVFSVLAGMLTAAMTLYASPWGRQASLAMVAEVAASDACTGLKSRTFYTHFENVTFYADGMDNGRKAFRNVFIEDRRQADFVTTTVSQRAERLPATPMHPLRFRLYDGVVTHVNVTDHSDSRIQFDSYDFSVIPQKAGWVMQTLRKRPKTMSGAELEQIMGSPTTDEKETLGAVVEYHTRLAIPLACLVFGCLALAVGLTSKTQPKPMRLVSALLLPLAYFLMLLVGYNLGCHGIAAPRWSIWTPNIVIGASAAGLFIRQACQ